MRCRRGSSVSLRRRCAPSGPTGKTTSRRPRAVARPGRAGASARRRGRSATPPRARASGRGTSPAQARARTATRRSSGGADVCRTSTASPAGRARPPTRRRADSALVIRRPSSRASGSVGSIAWYPPPATRSRPSSSPGSGRPRAATSTRGSGRGTARRSGWRSRARRPVPRRTWRCRRRRAPAPRPGVRSVGRPETTITKLVAALLPVVRPGRLARVELVERPAEKRRAEPLADHGRAVPVAVAVVLAVPVLALGEQVEDAGHISPS